MDARANAIRGVHEYERQSAVQHLAALASAAPARTDVGRFQMVQVVRDAFIGRLAVGPHAERKDGRRVNDLFDARLVCRSETLAAPIKLTSHTRQLLCGCVLIHPAAWMMALHPAAASMTVLALSRSPRTISMFSQDRLRVSASFRTKARTG